MTERWQRREFLRFALIQLGAWPLVSTLGCDGGDSGKPEKDLPHDAGPEPEPDPMVDIGNAVRERVAQVHAGAMLDAYFGTGEPRNLEFIGARYLLQVAPDHSDEQVLAALEPTIRRIERHLSDEAAIAALRNAVTTEFEGVDVVDLDGWTLSPTECALCALLWIADKRKPLGDAGVATDDDDADDDHGDAGA